MNTYKARCYRLFNKITDIISRMQIIQQETEKILLSYEKTAPNVKSDNASDEK